MLSSVVTVAPTVGRPMICEEEVCELAAQFGAPVRRTFHIQADEYIHSYRWQPNPDRRAEVVFAIQDPVGHVWVHAKAHYPAHIFRLPSGGVEMDECIHGALLREVEEETSLDVRIRRFLGIIQYCFHYNGSTTSFASYVFHLQSDGGAPRLPDDDEISAFRAVMPCQLLQLSADMRNLVGDRRGWGQWRSLAHDLVYDLLESPGASGYD